MNGVYLNRAAGRSRFYSVPESFNQLSGRQLVALSGLLHTRMKADEMAYRVLLVLLAVRQRPRLAWNLLVHITHETVHSLLPLTEWAFRENTLTRQLLPVLRIPFSWKKLYGPADNLANLTFVEFIKAEALFLDYVRHAEESSLNTLVAILYRPKRAHYNPKSTDFDGDIREKYNDHLLEARVKQVARLPLATRQAVFLFYDGCRSQIIAQYGNIFKSPEREESGKARGWGHVLRSLAGSVNEYERTAFQPLGTVLADLEMAILENKELEERLEKLKQP